MDKEKFHFDTEYMFDNFKKLFTINFVNNKDNI